MTPTKRKSTTPYRAPRPTREIVIAVAAAVAVLVLTATAIFLVKPKHPAASTTSNSGPTNSLPAVTGTTPATSGSGLVPPGATATAPPVGSTPASTAP